MEGCDKDLPQKKRVRQMCGIIHADVLGAASLGVGLAMRGELKGVV